MRRAAVVLTVLGMALTACGASDGTLEVSDARVGEPTGPNAALYFTASGAVDRLLGAETDVAATVELHETTTRDDGTIGMQAIDGLDLPAGDSLVLEPGGFHLMLIDVDRLEVGESIDVTLRWENAGEMLIEAEVVDPSETIGNDS